MKKNQRWRHVLTYLPSCMVPNKIKNKNCLHGDGARSPGSGSHCLTAQVDSAVLLYSIVRVTCQEFTHDW